MHSKQVPGCETGRGRTVGRMGLETAGAAGEQANQASEAPDFFVSYHALESPIRREETNRKQGRLGAARRKRGRPDGLLEIRIGN